MFLIRRIKNTSGKDYNNPSNFKYKIHLGYILQHLVQIKHVFNENRTKWKNICQHVNYIYIGQ